MAERPYVYSSDDGANVQPNAAGLFVNATHCSKADWVETSGIVVFSLFYVLSSVILVIGVRWLITSIRHARRRAQERVHSAQSRGKRPNPVDVLETKPQFGRSMFVWGLIAVVAQIIALVVLGNSMQHDLSVPESDAIADSNNFLTPFQDVFQFFEDGQTVRIGQAVGAQQFEEVGLLLKWGVVGGVACGLVGAALSTMATFISTVFSFFVPNAQGLSLPTSCSVGSGATADIQSLARPFWILASFAWPAVFVQKGCIGVFIGSGETFNWMVAILASIASAIILYFGLIGGVAHTTVVGVIYLVPGYVFVGVAFVLFWRQEFRDKYHLHAPMMTPRGLDSAATAARDGLALMLKDLCLTIQASTTNMLAARLGLGQQYQLSIYNNLQRTFGYVASTNGGSIFPAMLGYSMRLVGSRMLGQGKVHAFIKVANAYLVGAVLFGVISTTVMLATMSGGPYFFSADTVCMYLEKECTLPVYKDIFQNINGGYALNAIMALVNVVWGVLTAILYACLDFRFVRNATIVMTLALYIPASLIAFYAFGTVLSLQIAAALPTVGVTAAYYIRFRCVLCPQLLKGERNAANAVLHSQGASQALVALSPRSGSSCASSDEESVGTHKQNSVEEGESDGHSSRRLSAECHPSAILINAELSHRSAHE